jgi:hypothetical protein
MLQHPLMLAWLGGAVVPLVLHLLSRSGYRAVNWGAMMFLTGTHAGAQHAARFKQWVLLLLRMAVVGVLAVALARPVISPRYASVPTAGLTTGSTAAVVIILDDSASMGYTTNGKSRLDLAREVTLQLLSALKRGDAAALLLPGSRDYQPPAPPSVDLQSIASRVSDLEPDTAQPDFASELNRAADLLEHAAPADHEIYLICDRAALGWRNVNDAFVQHWQSSKSTGNPPRVTVIPVGGDEADNVAVEAIEPLERPLIKDQPDALIVRVHNYGPAAVNDLPLNVWTGTRSIKDLTISLPPRSVRSVTVPARFGEAGSKVISAAVHSTGLTSDDRLDVSLDVLEQLRVLIVRPEQKLPAGSGSIRPTTSPATRPTTRPTTRPATQPLSPVETALASTVRRGTDPFVASITTPAAFTPEMLRKNDVVILDGVTGLRSADLKSLQQFVEAGGGLLEIPDGVAKPAELNSTLRTGGINLLPAPLKAAVFKPTHIASFEKQHQVFRALSPRNEPLASLNIARFFTVLSPSNDTRILARYTTGDPFVIEMTLGKGRILQLTTAFDPQANSLVQLPVGSSLLQAMVRYLCANAAADRNLWPGQFIVVNTEDPVDNNSAGVQLPSSNIRDPAIVTRLGDHTEIRYQHTGKPGTYRLHYKTAGREKTLNYVVSTGHGDSDLTTLTDAQWKTMADHLGLDRVDLSHTTVATAIDNQRGGREIWIDLLAAVLGLMMLEMLLSRWWTFSDR